MSGDRFWDREHELSELSRLLREGANVSLVAPRRVGKTSVMRELAIRLERHFTCLHVDLQKCRDAKDAVVELSLATRDHVNLWGRTKEVFRNVLASVESLKLEDVAIKIQDGVAGDWAAKGDRLLEELAKSDPPIILLIDEIPILVNRLLKGPDHEVTPERIAKADRFVSWLRAATIRHRASIRFVIAGSIGLEPVLRQGGLSAAFNTFTPFELEPWDDETAHDCLGALANNYGIELSSGAPEQVTHLLGCCIPHHVQLFWSHLHDDAIRGGRSAVGPDDVDRVYRERMLSSRGHTELSHFEERLHLVLGPRVLPLALDLLTEAAVSGRLTQEAALRITRDIEGSGDDASNRLRTVLGILEHDGYLCTQDGDFVFVSRLVRDWWERRFSFGFIPASERTRKKGE